MIERTVKQNNTNVAVAKKEKLFMKSIDQLNLMEKYTEVHKQPNDKLNREIQCLKTLFPKVFRPMYDNDLILGRFDALPIGFGSVTSVGGPGHYYDLKKLENLKKELPKEEKRIDKLIEYWKNNDLREIFYKENLKENILGRFVDVNYPAIATARFSGMYLDYNFLLDHGIENLKKYIENNCLGKLEKKVMIEALELLQDVIEHHINEIKEKLKTKLDLKYEKQMKNLLKELIHIKEKKPNSFIGAMQLSWLYSSLAGVVNFGRMDDYLGDYLVHDLENNIIEENEAMDYIESLWRLIEVKRTNVNGRVVVGGRGRRNEKNADVFAKLAIIVTNRAKLVEPQFTLRIYDKMNEEIYNLALNSIGDSTTYPILYNDDVNIPAVANAMNVDMITAEQYVPFGCGEFVLSTQAIGTPNACLNVLKIFDIYLHDGIDQFDYKFKYPENNNFKKMNEINNFDDLLNGYFEVLNYFIEITSISQKKSYEVMNENVGFIFTSILTNDCILKGKMVLDGGVRYLGGTNEMYGNMNTVDALAAIKKLIFIDKKYSLNDIIEATAKDFENFENLKKDLINAPKYGNDIDFVDDIAILLHEHLCNGVRNSASKVGLDSFLVVVINNQVNTEWGRATASTADGRIAGMYMSNANNPQSGADVFGPTAMLNSLVKMKNDIHAGSVQNIKFSKKMFKVERHKIEALFKTYFKKGGPQLMVTIVDPKELEEAFINPEKYQNLTVRVGGFSARFVNLERDVQQEIMARTLNE